MQLNQFLACNSCFFGYIEELFTEDDGFLFFGKVDKALEKIRADIYLGFPVSCNWCIVLYKLPHLYPITHVLASNIWTRSSKRKKNTTP